MLRCTLSLSDSDSLLLVEHVFELFNLRTEY